MFIFWRTFSFFVFMLMRGVPLINVMWPPVDVIVMWLFVIIVLRFWNSLVILCSIAGVALTFRLLLFLFFKSCGMFDVLPHLGRVDFDIVGREEAEIYWLERFQLVHVCLPPFDGIECSQPGREWKMGKSWKISSLTLSYPPHFLCALQRHWSESRWEETDRRESLLVRSSSLPPSQSLPWTPSGSRAWIVLS